MKYRITRHDGEEDEITAQEFENYDDAYELLEEIYGDMCCSDADYEDRPYYEIIELKDWLCPYNHAILRGSERLYPFHLVPYSKDKNQKYLNVAAFGSVFRLKNYGFLNHYQYLAFHYLPYYSIRRKGLLTTS